MGVRAAVTEVGPAVFNGGVSTFLAISAVALSGNYVWRLFFKCFMMITFFGLFPGNICCGALRKLRLAALLQVLHDDHFLWALSWQYLLWRSQETTSGGSSSSAS